MVPESFASSRHSSCEQTSFILDTAQDDTLFLGFDDVFGGGCYNLVGPREGRLRFRLEKLSIFPKLFTLLVMQSVVDTTECPDRKSA